MANRAESGFQISPEDVRSAQGPVSGIKDFKTVPNQSDWEAYGKNKGIGLADGNPGLIVPQSLRELKRLYGKQQRENLTFFEFNPTSKPEHDQTLGEVKQRGRDNPSI